MSLGLGWERSSGPAWGTGEARTGCSRHPTSHPFPFGRGRNGSLTFPCRFGSWVGGGERRAAGPSLAPLGGLGKGKTERRRLARLGLFGVEREEGGVRSMAALSLFLFCFLRVHSGSSIPLSQSRHRRGPSLFAVAGHRELYLRGNLLGDLCPT